MIMIMIIMCKAISKSMSLTATYRDCARQVGAFLGKLRPCALPQRVLHLAQLLWRYLVNGSAVVNYGSHPIHFS